MSLVSLCAIVFFAFLTEAVVGFGSTVLTVTLAAHILPLDELLPAFVPTSIVLSSALLAKGRGKVAWGFLLRRVLPSVAVGMAAGLVLFRLKSELWLQLGFALFVVGLSLLDLIRGALDGQSGALTAPDGSLAAPQVLPAPIATGLLVLGGIVHGLFGSGGPMIVYVAGRQIQDKRGLRATLAVLWLVLNVVLLCNYASLGLIDARSLVRGASLLPALGLAVLLGDWVHGRLPPQPFKILVNLVLLVAGGSLAVRTLRSLFS